MDGPQPQNFRSLLHVDDDDGDTASQRSISLSSPMTSPRASTHSVDLDNAYAQDVILPDDPHSKRVSKPYTLDTDLSSETDDMSLYNRDNHESPNTSAPPSVFEEPKTMSYPPPAHDTESLAESFTSVSSRKARPESMLVLPPVGRLILGVALIDFNHLVRLCWCLCFFSNSWSGWPTDRMVERRYI